MNPKQTVLDLAETDKVEEAKKLLKEQGLRVSEVVSGDARITKLDDVIRLFYSLMARYHNRKVPPSASSTDRKVISDLLTSRQSTGISRKAAFAEVCRLVETLFKYEKQLNLNSKVSSTRILTNSWIVERLIRFINDEDDQAATKAFDGASVIANKVASEPEFHKKASDKLDEIYEKVVKGNGKQAGKKRRIPNLKGRRGRD